MLAPNAAVLLLACPVYTEAVLACQMTRVRHRTHAPDAMGCVRTHTQRGWKSGFLTECVQGADTRHLGASSASRFSKYN